MYLGAVWPSCTTDYLCRPLRLPPVLHPLWSRLAARCTHRSRRRAARRRAPTSSRTHCGASSAHSPIAANDRAPHTTATAEIARMVWTWCRIPPGWRGSQNRSEAGQQILKRVLGNSGPGSHGLTRIVASISAGSASTARPVMTSLTVCTARTHVRAEPLRSRSADQCGLGAGLELACGHAACPRRPRPRRG